MVSDACKSFYSRRWQNGSDALSCFDLATVIKLPTALFRLPTMEKKRETNPDMVCNGRCISASFCTVCFKKLGVNGILDEDLGVAIQMVLTLDREACAASAQTLTWKKIAKDLHGVFVPLNQQKQSVFGFICG